MVDGYFNGDIAMLTDDSKYKESLSDYFKILLGLHYITLVIRADTTADYSTNRNYKQKNTWRLTWELQYADDLMLDGGKTEADDMKILLDTKGLKVNTFRPLASNAEIH